MTTHLMTAEELFNLPDDSVRHDMIRGELLTTSPAGEKLEALSLVIGELLFQHVGANNLGIAYGADTGFKPGFRIPVFEIFN